MTRTWSISLLAALGLGVPSSARAEDVVLSEDFAYTQYRPPAGELTGDAVDAYAATWTVSNSGNDDPTTAADCEVGNNPLNLYPILIDDSDDMTFSGGRIRSDIPLQSDWGPTYCNSAALFIRGGDRAIVEHVRVEGSWDAFRFAQGAVDFTLRGVWASNVRDDAIENDQVRSGRIEDSLFDGTFQGLSLDPGGSGGPADVDEHLVVLDHYIQRLTPFSYQGTPGHGTLFKGTSYAPRMEIVHSVFAAEVDAFASEGRLTSVLDQLQHCENNYFLWLGRGPAPAAYTDHLPPECFTVFEGDEAAQRWTALRTNWIDCHPEVPRAETDPVSDPRACDPLFIDNGLEPSADPGGTSGGAQTTGSGEDTSGEGTTSDGGAPSDSTGATPPTTGDTSTTHGAPSRGESGEGTGDDGARQSEEAAGCGCRSSNPTGGLWLGLLALLRLRRRRSSLQLPRRRASDDTAHHGSRAHVVSRSRPARL
ncbi:MAG: hypothetical protein ACE37F_25035 [Nannocystaceae bacterium]|nr:hypothetical protein [bacterium]